MADSPFPLDPQHFSGGTNLTTPGEVGLASVLNYLDENSAPIQDDVQEFLINNTITLLGNGVFVTVWSYTLEEGESILVTVDLHIRRGTAAEPGTGAILGRFLAYRLAGGDAFVSSVSVPPIGNVYLASPGATAAQQVPTSNAVSLRFEAAYTDDAIFTGVIRVYGSVLP